MLSQSTIRASLLSKPFLSRTKSNQISLTQSKARFYSPASTPQYPQHHKKKILSRPISCLPLQGARREQDRQVCHHCWTDCRRNYGDNLLRAHSDEEGELEFSEGRPREGIAETEERRNEEYLHDKGIFAGQ